jgi:alkanesulfonate monooxygenase SsuD/methylene tetrahydromethanopterin reductase-like flavin-dependent oxidoreductase (luciferase family)
MKFSFNCENTYEDPEIYTEEFRQQVTYPVPLKFYKPEIGVKSFENHLDMVRYADDKFDWISASEHHGWPILQAPNAAVLLSAFAAVTKRAKLAWMGPLVSMNNPVRIAEECAMLDQMSNGRLICLFLRGTPNEFLAYGVRADETRERTQEAFSLIERALTEPYPFSWQGRYFKYRTIGMWPSLTQNPMFPILSSGNSLESATFAAQHRYGLGISFYPPEMVADLVAFYKAECNRFGWEPSSEWILYRGFATVASTDEEAAARAHRFFGETNSFAMGVTTGRGALMASELRFANPPKRYNSSQKDSGASGFALGTLAFQGRPETVVKQIEDFAELTGVGVLDLAFNAGGLTGEEAFDALRRFGDEVIPGVRRHSASTTRIEVASVSE